MCKASFLVLLVLSIAAPCFGQSAFLEKNKSAMGVILSGSYTDYSSRYMKNYGALITGISISIHGRADICFGPCLTFGDEGETSGGCKVGTEIFLIKQSARYNLMVSVGMDGILSDQSGGNVWPIILTSKPFKNKNIYPMVSLAYGFYDTDFSSQNSFNHGSIVRCQVLLFARTSDKFALTFGPTYMEAKNMYAISASLGFLFI